MPTKIGTGYISVIDKSEPMPRSSPIAPGVIEQLREQVEALTAEREAYRDALRKCQVHAETALDQSEVGPYRYHLGSVQSVAGRTLAAADL